MHKEITSKKQLFYVSILSTVVFYLFANGYRFFNPMFSGDSLLMIYQNDSAWQIALGRFVQPFLVFLRGGIVNPFLISVISIFWLSLAVYFLLDFLNIRKILSVVFTAAVMSCNITIIAANATFLHNADFYAFALFLAVLGIWLIHKEKLLFVVSGILSLSVSLGVYQSYICVAIAMVMIHFIFKMLDRPTVKNTLICAVRYLISFIVAAGIYYAVWKIFQKVFNIWTANTYNGLASVGDYSDVNIFSSVITTYKNVFHHFLHPETFTTMPFGGISLSIFWVYIIRILNIATILLAVFALLRITLKHKTTLWQKIMQLIIVILFPLGINFVCLISKGMEHTLMIYAFCFVYILAIKASEVHYTLFADTANTKKAIIPRLTVLLSVMVIVWSNIVYANQVYLKKDLQEKATLSMMTRIVYAIESADDYVPGVTKVAFCGSFETTSYVTDMEAFKDVIPYGMGKSSLTYIGTDYAFLTHILNANMLLTRVDGSVETIKEMPNYPAKGSIAYVDGILVVKISD